MRIYVKVSRDLSSEADKYLLSSTGLRLVPQQERQCYSRGISNSVATHLKEAGSVAVFKRLYRHHREGTVALLQPDEEQQITKKCHRAPTSLSGT